MKTNTRKAFLRVAAFLVLFTFLGHTAGLKMPIPAEQTQRLQTFELMKQTEISMPMGTVRTYADTLLGANLCLSIFLLVTGLVFIALSRREGMISDQPILLFQSLGLGGVAIVSSFYFFPLPAACTAIAAILGLVVWKSHPRI